jgi:hypothetical protein
MLDTKIGTMHPNYKRARSQVGSSVRQKRDRRKVGLIKKASEYSKMCGANWDGNTKLRRTIG